MPLLVRKIEKGKWLQKDILNGEVVSADAITNCMKTSKNTLSTWSVENEDQINDAVLAIVSVHQHLDTIDVVLLNQDNLAEIGIAFKQTPGATPVPTLVESHVDIVELSYQSLGKVADCIITCFKEEKVKRFTRGELKKILLKAIEADKLSIDAIAPDIASKLS